MISVMRPCLPKAEQVLPYLKEIDESRWYTNFGPLEKRFRDRLAERLAGSPLGAIHAGHLATFANGTLALVSAFQNLGLSAGTRCLAPAWTFQGSIAAILAANLEPVLIDVDYDTWMPAPDRLLDEADKYRAACALLVVPFGARFDYRKWHDLAVSAGLRLVFDAASAAFSLADALQGRPGASPVMISTHATKPVSTGEGGVLISSDEDFIKRCQRWSNFGIYNTEPIGTVGTNAKLSEYHAAIGLASLDAWEKNLSALHLRARMYVDDLEGLGIEFAPNIRQEAPATTFSILSSVHAGKLATLLRGRGIGTKQWWGQGAHSHPAYRKFAHESLPVTDRLGRITLGIPMQADLSVASLVRVVGAITELHQQERGAA